MITALYSVELLRVRSQAQSQVVHRTALMVYLYRELIPKTHACDLSWICASVQCRGLLIAQHLLSLITQSQVKMLIITANVPQNFGSAEAGLNYTGKNEVRFYQNLVRQKGSLNVIENLTNAHGNEKFRLYYDAAAGASTTGGTIYPIKIFVPTS